MEVFVINRLALLDKCDENSNFWIVNIDSDVISKVISNNVFGSVKKKSINIHKFKSGDIVLLNTKVDRQFHIVGVSMVDYISRNNKRLFNHFISPIKVHLKSIKFFSKPISYMSVCEDISINNFYTKELIQISPDDVKIIVNRENLTASMPFSIQTLSFKLDDFVLDTIELAYQLLANKDDKMIPIRDFISYVDELLRIYGVKKNMKELENFYSHNIWKLKFKHVPARDPDINLKLYDAHANSKNFGYIVFKH